MHSPPADLVEWQHKMPLCQWHSPQGYMIQLVPTLLAARPPGWPLLTRMSHNKCHDALSHPPCDQPYGARTSTCPSLTHGPQTCRMLACMHMSCNQPHDGLCCSQQTQSRVVLLRQAHQAPFHVRAVQQAGCINPMRWGSCTTSTGSGLHVALGPKLSSKSRHPCQSEIQFNSHAAPKVQWVAP